MTGKIIAPEIVVISDEVFAAVDAATSRPREKRYISMGIGNMQQTATISGFYAHDGDVFYVKASTASDALTKIAAEDRRLLDETYGIRST